MKGEQSVQSVSFGRLVQRWGAPVFFLTGGIEHVEKWHLVVDHALLAIRIFDGLPAGRLVRGRRAGQHRQWVMMVDVGWRAAHWVISRIENAQTGVHGRE